MQNDIGKTHGFDNVNACSGKMEVPTPREREALAAMKSIKERVREIKKRLDELNALKNDAHAEEIVSLESEMARLKTGVGFLGDKKRGCGQRTYDPAGPRNRRINNETLGETASSGAIVSWRYTAEKFS